MEMRTCGTCGGHWVNDQFYWSNGKKGRDLDLAGLVCNLLPPEKGCINPKRGQTGGQTWALRQKIVEDEISKLI